MKLVRLIEAEMYRDGGSLEATFLESDGLERSLFLLVGPPYDDEMMHHKKLYPCRPAFDDEGEFVSAVDPIPKGSSADREWLDAISAWIEENPPSRELQAFLAAEEADPDGDHFSLFEAMTSDDRNQRYLFILFDHIPKRDS